MYLQIFIVHYIPGIVLSTRGYSSEQKDTNPCLHGTYILAQEIDNKSTIKIYQIVINLQKKTEIIGNWGVDEMV